MKEADCVNTESIHRKTKVFNLTYGQQTEQIKKYPCVKIIPDIRNEAFTWCEESFGDKWIWANYGYGAVEIYFINEDDALVFKLKYG